MYNVTDYDPDPDCDYDYDLSGEEEVAQFTCVLYKSNNFKVTKTHLLGKFILLFPIPCIG